MSYLLSQAVRCGTCGAMPGEPCKIPKTDIPKTVTHQTRRERWFDAEQARLRAARDLT